MFFGDLYPNKECYDAGTASGLRVLLKIRMRIASGPVTDYWTHPNYIGWVRKGQGPKVYAVIISNANSYVFPCVTFEREDAETNGDPRSL